MNKQADSTVRAYLDEVGTLPRDAIIGNIVMFTIIDTPIERKMLEKHFTDLDLDTDKLPPEVAPLDAFKKATKQSEETYTLPNGNTASVLCREVASNTIAVTRQITREVRDSTKRTLSYAKGIECTFYRGKPAVGQTRITPQSERVRLAVVEEGLDAEELEVMETIKNQIHDAYLKHYQYLDGNKIRAVVRDYLKHLNAIELRGGVYFVHANRIDELTKLTTLVERIGNGCNMRSFPLVDLPAQREWIVEEFQKDAAQKLADIVAEIAELKATRKSITPAAYAKLKDKYDIILSQADEYLSTLELSQDTTSASAEVALDALTDLQLTMLKGA